MSPRNPPLAIAIALLLLAGMAPSAAAPPAEEADYVGEIISDNVNVRSGPSTNYYRVTKLDAGNRVRVIGREGDWLALAPPDGCYSLIADTYVDAADGVSGVVNGDNVRVRVGSLLEPNQYYACQMKLSRGAEVEIRGHAGEFGVDRQGYYKIVPPDGAKLWVSAQYVQRVPEELLELEAAGRRALRAPPGAGPAASASTDAPAASDADTAAATITEAADPAVVAASIKNHRAQIEQIDADLKAELAKPLFRRDLEPIMARFAPLANQTLDEFTALYAATRIAHLTDMVEMIEAVARVRELGEQVKTDRKAALTARAGIRPVAPAIKEGFDAEGELRYSAIYDSPAGPQRYRLTDPAVALPRTIGYVEIPPNSNIHVTDYLGRIVGVRARQITLQTGGVDPVPIYLASEIVVLEKAAK